MIAERSFDPYAELRRALALARSVIAALKRDYDPSQPRDEEGQWSDTGGGGLGGDGPDSDVSFGAEVEGASSSASEAASENYGTSDPAKAEKMGVAAGAARSAGLPKDSPVRMRYGGAGYQFKVGDDEYTAAAHYDSAGSEIVFFDGGLADDAAIKGIAAHEVTHHLFHTSTTRARDEERAAIEASKGLSWREGPLAPDGSLREGYEDDYPVYALLEPYTGVREKAKLLEKKDGISDYSRSYWKAYSEGKGFRQTVLNETLAEIARVKATGEDVKIARVWLSFYNALQKAYKLIEAEEKK